MPAPKRSLSAKRAILAAGRVPLLGDALFHRYLVRKYTRRVVTRAKVRNFVAAQRDMLNRNVAVQSLPWCLNLDTFNACNLKCPFCPTGTGQQERSKARLPLERAKHVIDLVKGHALEVRLYNWGEPFLNPDIFELIRYAHDAGLYTIVNSNLSVDVPDFARKVVDSGLDRLQVSLDGITQDALEKYRRRASLEKIFGNIKAIAAERRGRQAEGPFVSLAFLVFRHNEHQLPELERMRAELGADEFFPRRAFIFHESFIPQHPDFAPMQPFFHGTCEYLYSELTVEATGAVSPCCANMAEKWDVGRIEEVSDLRTYWNGAHYRAMRAFTGGRSDSKVDENGREILCAHCNFVEHPGFKPGRLSPVPPAFQAAGKEYAHGIGETSLNRITRAG